MRKGRVGLLDEPPLAGGSLLALKKEKKVVGLCRFLQINHGNLIKRSCGGLMTCKVISCRFLVSKWTRLSLVRLLRCTAKTNCI